MPAKLTLLMTTFILLLALPCFGQTCGDATGDGQANISDMVYIINYISYPYGGPAPIDSASAEWDDHIGITISDVVAIADYFFVNWDTLICGATQMYSFAASPSDTIFLPAMYGIPDGLDKVQLPISFSLDTNTTAFYLPMQLGTGSSTSFELDSIHRHLVGGMSSWPDGDTTVLVGFEAAGNGIVRQGDAFTLHFSRVGDGVTSIETELFDYTGARKWAISNGDGDLYRPVIVTVDIPIPPDTLTASESALSFQTMAGNQSLDSFYVEFGTTGTPVQFGLEPSDSWILIDSPVMPEQLTTPTTTLVTVDSDQMPIGTHNGRIDIIPQDSSVVAIPDYIDVTLTVYDPNLYPNGDLDCNGIIDLGDLTLMIAYLFLGGASPQPCQ